MSSDMQIAGEFENNRSHLKRVATRILGSETEAEDAVQEAWLRLSRSDRSSIENLTGWLTTVVSRICLDTLRTRKYRDAESLSIEMSEVLTSSDDQHDPEHETLLIDSVSLALVVLLEKLSPLERVAFVLHESFDMPFESIASIVGRTPEATRKLASRARQHTRDADLAKHVEIHHLERITLNFLHAARNGDLAAVVAVLAPDVVFHSDGSPIFGGKSADIKGAQAVAKLFVGRAQGARVALVNGSIGIVVVSNGRCTLAFRLEILNDKIAHFDAIANASTLHKLNLLVLADP